MTYDNWDEDSDYEDYESDELETEELAPCPECRAEMHVDAEACPSCGHWLSTAERHKLWDAGSKSKASLSVGKTLLVVVLVMLFLGSMLGMIR